MFVSLLLVFFFVKQKTAYEMRISDWSSDVCSSDLDEIPPHMARRCERLTAEQHYARIAVGAQRHRLSGLKNIEAVTVERVAIEARVAECDKHRQIGRAYCRDHGSGPVDPGGRRSIQKTKDVT